MRNYLKLFLIILFFLFSNKSYSTEKNSLDLFYSFSDDSFVSFSELVARLSDYKIIILGENHDNEDHHNYQFRLMDEVSSLRRTNVSVGLEFISWMHQDPLDKYVSGYITENDFLELIGWGNIPFDYYRPLIEISEFAFGINAPSFLTRKIARQGLESLTDQEKRLLPPDFELGSSLYFDRFKEVMDGMNHPMPEIAIERLFSAQSLWDDTMAYKSIEKSMLSQNPFFIIVGNFHARYKLGLPARLLNRYNDINLAVLTHVDARNLTSVDIENLTKPHPKYGEIADFIIFTNTSQE
jgi:uncharacterized iron-regulated protein